MGSPRTWIDDGVFYKIEQESNILRMGGGSWTINLDTINLSNVEGFCYQTSKGHYTISKQMAQLKGFERVFQGERKLVVPLKNWHHVAKPI